MPTVVSFNKRVPPEASKAGRGTLAELMAKSKAAADAKSTAMSAESPTIMQGVGNLAQVISGGIREGRADRQLAEGNKALAGIMGGVDPTQGATPEQIASAGVYDPEVMKSLLADRVERQRTLADADQWQPATPEEKAALGAGPDDPIMRNKHNGEFKSLATGGNTTIATGDKVETEWGKQLAKNTADMLSKDVLAGQAGVVKSAQMEQLKKLMGNSYQGSEALVSEWINKNLGISLGPQADATQAFGAIIDNMVPKERVEGSGSTSNYDAQMFKNALPTLLKSRNANQIIMSYIDGIAAHDQAIAQIAQKASNMGDPTAAREFYYSEVAKLKKPLSDLGVVVDRIQKENEAADAAGGGTPANPANPDAVAGEGETIVNPQPDPKKPGGGIKSRKDNGDGTVTYTFHNGKTSVQRVGN
jgi:hypothetical protein